MIRKLKGNPFLSPIDHPLMVKAAEALEEVFGEKLPTLAAEALSRLLMYSAKH
nr:hypothetical protein [Paenibacillus larvae]